MSYGSNHYAHKRPAGDGVSVALHKDQNRGARLVVKLCAATQEALCWVVGQNFTFAIGVNEDANKIRISPHDRGYIGSDSSGLLTMIFPAWPSLPLSSQAMCQCKFEIDDGALILTLPDWN